MKNFFVLLMICAVCCLLFVSSADAAGRRAGGCASCQGCPGTCPSGVCQPAVVQPVPPLLVEKTVIKKTTVDDVANMAEEGRRCPLRRAAAVPARLGRRIAGGVLRGGGRVVRGLVGRRD